MLSQYIIDNVFQIMYNQKRLNIHIDSYSTYPINISVFMLMVIEPPLSDYYHRHMNCDLEFIAYDKPLILQGLNLNYITQWE